MNFRRDEPSWQDPTRPEARATSREDLLAPRTQLVTDRDAYLGQGRHDIGRRISDDQVELFITADVPGSLQREFIQHTPEFIALHDLGAAAGLRLLASMAGAAGSRVQRLSIRRQGHDVALAVLQFVEMPLGDESMVRVYSTDINADAQTRAQGARVLLGHSRLGVLLVGELPPHALSGQLGPLHESLMRSSWPNRDLLMVPLGSSTSLAAHATQLAAGSNVSVQLTPQAGKPGQAWACISGAWNRQAASVGTRRTLNTELAQPNAKPALTRAEAPTEPMGLNPLPTRPAAPPIPTLPTTPPTAMPKVGGNTDWKAYVQRCLLIKGAVVGCVFDLHNSQPLAAAGGPPSAERLAQQGVVLLSQMHDAARALGLGQTRAEATVSTASHHLILRPVPGHSGVALHLVVSASTGNLTLARMQLERIEAPQ